MRIDAHQHYWSLGLGHNNWPGPDLAPIYRDFTPADLHPHLEKAGIDATVLVQAAPNAAETEFLLNLADADKTVAAVVGWVDVEASDAAEVLTCLRNRPKLRGIRPMLQGIEDTAYILRPSVIETLSHLQKLGLCFDALIQPRHVPVIAALADRLPGLPIVVDHAAKPFIAAGLLEPWRADMAALAKRGNVMVKLSGLVTEAGGDYSLSRLQPYAAHLINVFGPQRMMFGSDWPVVTLDIDYGAWVSLAEALTSTLTTADRADVFGGTAARFYGIRSNAPV